jgi:uncharacterized protein involved in response to NO
MSFPNCKHAKRKRRSYATRLRWLGGEPYRVFFLSGILFSIAGVLLWPMFYNGLLSFYPGIAHAHIMIQAFGGAFVIGFLGTAGPRVIAAPRLQPWELLPLFFLHVASGICHLLGMTAWGDWLFLGTLAAFIFTLAGRVLFFRKSLPPPPFLLAAIGLLCGLAGMLIGCIPSLAATASLYRLAGLLLNQGFLLGPVMGVGIFLFPRLLGNSFGETKPGPATHRSWRNMIFNSLALVASFPIEIWWSPTAGRVIRATAFVFAIAQVRWFKNTKFTMIGPLANALRFFCIPLCIIGLIAPILLIEKRIALEHLLFISGYGLVILIAASRVLFGHSGSVERFANHSWIARLIVICLLAAALIRTSADFIPSVTIKNYQYAAAFWIAATSLWLIWHSRRFFKKDEDDE